MYTDIALTPELDSHNSSRYPIHFTVYNDSIEFTLEGSEERADRVLRFSVEDFQTLVKIAKVLPRKDED